MQLVRWIFLVIVMLFVGWFAYQNFEQHIIIKFWQYQSKPLPLILVLFASFLLGNIVWFFKTAFQNYKLKRELRDFQKDNEKLIRELASLRNISIEDVDKSEEGGSH